MSNNKPNDTREEHASQDPPREQPEGGHSGEGAASAMEQMISQGEQQRRQSPRPESAGGNH